MDTDSTSSDSSIDRHVEAFLQVRSKYAHVCSSENALRKMLLDEALLLLSACYWPPIKLRTFYEYLRFRTKFPISRSDDFGWSAGLLVASNVLRKRIFLSCLIPNPEEGGASVSVLLYLYAIACCARAVKAGVDLEDYVRNKVTTTSLADAIQKSAENASPALHQSANPLPPTEPEESETLRDVSEIESSEDSAAEKAIETSTVLTKLHHTEPDTKKDGLEITKVLEPFLDNLSRQLDLINKRVESLASDMAPRAKDPTEDPGSSTTCTATPGGERAYDGDITNKQDHPHPQRHHPYRTMQDTGTQAPQNPKHFGLDSTSSQTLSPESKKRKLTTNMRPYYPPLFSLPGNHSSNDDNTSMFGPPTTNPHTDTSPYTNTGLYGNTNTNDKRAQNTYGGGFLSSYDNGFPAVRLPWEKEQNENKDGLPRQGGGLFGRRF
ncbi:hypothetical protein F4779DRAFT_547958 [Xylariaceae sp. FL0662B]|nr:hypothetical protein F4779DRAFT_547958 [Xylariaceae sp. FL0662B]